MDRDKQTAFSDLEWDVLLERLASRCGSDVAARALIGLEPAEDIEVARERMRLCAEAMESAEAGAPLPTPPIPDVAELLEGIARGAVPGSSQLDQLRRLLRSAREVRSFARARRDSHPLLAAALESDPGLDGLLTELERSLDSDGSLADAASTALAHARSRARERRSDIQRLLGKLVQRYREVLSGTFHAERDGRYVLPVRADAHFRVEGLVLGSSGSGNTLYVVPRELVEPGNKLRVAEADVEREEAIVLARLAGLARNLVEETEVGLRACIRGECVGVVARWAAEVSARPLQVTESPRIHLLQMRHPLLLLNRENIVPNDLRLEEGHALVVSGPNAGGKTVALKCLGLAVLMARSGIPLPVGAESRIGFFPEVASTMGDEQSLAQSLSTFSAHVSHLARILESTGPGTLVLLDEVAAGTDPDEGSALAAAVLEALVERGGAVAVTTHFERLKELADKHPRFENASVGFDFEQMRPTFHLTLGIPGASSALAVAARFGIDASIVSRAQKLLPEVRGSQQELLASLGREQSAAETARKEAEVARTRAEELLAATEAERAKLKEATRAQMGREAELLAASVRDARAQMRYVSERLKRQGVSRPDLDALEETINEAGKHLTIGSSLNQAAQVDAPPVAPPRAAQLVPGTQVRLNRLGQIAEVLEAPSRGRLRVLAGAMKLTVKTSEVSLIRSGQTARPKPRVKKQPLPDHPAVRSAPARTDATTCDLRGLRVDEALERVELFVDGLLQSGEDSGFVLHGHGTGVLKSAVRDLLPSLGPVQAHRPADRDEGGDAFTVLWLR